MGEVLRRGWQVGRGRHYPRHPRSDKMEKKWIINRATKTLVIIGLMMVPTGVTLRGADVTLYLVKKGIRYTQSDAGWPTADATNGYAFQADVYEAVPNSVTNDLVVA